MFKICCKCKVSKNIVDFGRDKYNKDGYNYVCKECKNKKVRKNYSKRREKSLAYNKEYHKKNKDKIHKRKSEYYQKNKEKRRVYERNYYKNNPQARIAKNLRIRIRDFFKGCYKPESAINHLGCSVEELKDYLESQFQPGMSWDNYGVHGWHVDHIKSLDSFDLTDLEQFKEACHYTNLQPLWAKDNWLKGARDV